MPCPFCQKEHDFTVEEALARLDGGPAEVRAALAGAGDAELNWSQPGRWSPRQIAFHLLDCELIYGTRFRKILAEEDAVLPAFDQNLWSEACTAGRDLANALDAFERLRRDNVAMLRAAAAAPAEKTSAGSVLDRAGRHPQYGVLTLRDHILHLSPHDRNHAAQIRREREKYGASNS